MNPYNNSLQALAENLDHKDDIDEDEDESSLLNNPKAESRFKNHFTINMKNTISHFHQRDRDL